MSTTISSRRKIALDEPSLAGNERKYLNQCIDSNWISWQGEFVGRTEKLLAEYCGTRHAMTTVNGTYALIMALQALGVGPGDEVIVPVLTMSATAFVVTSVGASVVWADSTKGSFVIDPEEIRKCITPKTKAVIVVHLYGFAVDMDAIKLILDPKGIPVIEDAAEAMGATINDRKVGSIGTIGCHSFHNKIIASGEGGAITLNDDQLFQKLLALRTPSPSNLGSEVLALNNRMSNITAAVALAQLERIEHLVENRRGVAKHYDQFLKAAVGISVSRERGDTRSVYWRYQIMLHKDYPLSREELILKLNANDVESRCVFSLMTEHPLYKPACHEKFPNALELSMSALDIPSGPNLTKKQIRFISDIIINPTKY